jgi:hypothetical protein
MRNYPGGRIGAVCGKGPCSPSNGPTVQAFLLAQVCLLFIEGPKGESFAALDLRQIFLSSEESNSLVGAAGKNCLSLRCYDLSLGEI